MNQMTPELMQALMMSGQQDPALAQIKRQQAMADMLRQQSMQGVPTRMAGRVAVPGWGDAIGNLASGFMANKMQPGIDEQHRAATARNADTRLKYAQALFESMRRQDPQMGMQAPSAPPSPYGEGY